MLIVEREAIPLLAALHACRAPQATKWIAATPA
ncbi:hypothetical protein GGD83_003915 [Rhodoblastus sphagnicola]|nr:hypothetical protein [Rhodoblastus sphagnicola]